MITSFVQYNLTHIVLTRSMNINNIIAAYTNNFPDETEYNGKKYITDTVKQRERNRTYVLYISEYGQIAVVGCHSFIFHFDQLKMNYLFLF